ncbi:hypothetical protein B0H34DRAFT_781738 [Crassisporium funariophilum]|nr:hypothetical protein B0H34DRAFT_781738 [Crassisporium funariophilum]
MWRGRTGFAALSSIRHKRCYTTPSVLDELAHRGFIQDVTRPDVLKHALASKQQTIYAGVDPTAKSLHIGHLIPLMVLLHFQLRGHRIIPLIGGATGRVGDPSGRLVERQLADIKQVDDNVASLTSSIQHFFKSAQLYATSRVSSLADNLQEPAVISNLEWHGSFGLLDFLQQVGLHARVNTMMNRESVRARLNSKQGLSFTEFTYQLLQAYDFYHLHKHRGCTIQVGGSDQWGNIIAGLELIGRPEPTTATKESPAEAFGIITPLLTTSSGEKFGKSAGNAVWLDPRLTSVFDFYQYFLKVTDADVEKHLKLFTLMDRVEIEEVLESHAVEPEKRKAQHRLASEVTELVHQSQSCIPLEKGATQASTTTKLLFGTDYAGLKAEDVISSFQDDPRLVRLTREEMADIPIAKLVAKHGLVSSNAASKSLIASKGLYINNQPVQDVHRKVNAEDLVDHKLVILRAGKDKILVLASTD